MKNFLKRLFRLQKNRYVGMYLYRYYKYKIYPKIRNKVRIEHVCTNCDGVKYELIHKSKPVVILFNNSKVTIKEYNQNQTFIWVPNENGILKLDETTIELEKQKNKKITKNSIIIISDRYEKADDNGEYFYEWMQQNKPEYREVYFAISKKSSHYERLKAKNFNILDMDSTTFREKYENADVIVSSVYSDYIENHKALRYFNKKANSRFIFLRHGVEYRGADIAINAMQKINYYNISTDLEKDKFQNSKIWFDMQLKKTGMSRILAEFPKRNEHFILFSPSWTQEAYEKDNIKESFLYQSIQNLINDNELMSTLESINKKFKVLIHPQLSDTAKSWKELENEYTEILMGDEICYAEIISNCSVYITDTSSTFFDASFREKPVIFYHQEKRIINDMGFDYTDVAPVVETSRELCSYIRKYTVDGENQMLKSKYRLKNKEKTNENIWELVKNG